VDQVVVVLTKKSEIAQIRATAVAFPPSDVVRIDEDGVGTAREAAMSVSAPEFSALGGGRISAGPALVHGVAHVVVESHHQRGVTGEASCDDRVDQTPVLELTCQL
jgi:hypothetical protein